MVKSVEQAEAEYTAAKADMDAAIEKFEAAQEALADARAAALRAEAAQSAGDLPVGRTVRHARYGGIIARVVENDGTGIAVEYPDGSVTYGYAASEWVAL